MLKAGALLSSFTLGLSFFAAFSASTSYKLNNYSIGPGGTNNAASTTYNLQGSVGEQANGSTASVTYTAQNGSIQTEQINVPLAPTLSNGSNTYYNMLNCIINTGNDPTDTTYALAVSTNNFASASYVQADGTLGSSAVYQSYTAWGGAGGTAIIGLTSSTSYEVEVAAKEGQFTNTEYGPYATAATVSPSITFSVSPSTSSLGNLLPGSVITSSNLSFTFATNAANGGNVYVSGQNTGLLSSRTGHTIAAYTGNLAGQTEGFGVQATNPTQTSGGPLSTVSPFNGSSNTVGAESTVPQQMLTASAPIVGGTANANMQAKASNITPASNDYQEVLTFIASASF
jgi:hypothetical protein